MYHLTAEAPPAPKRKAPKNGSAAEKIDGTRPRTGLKPVLEDMPKWELLKDIIEEVQLQRTLLLSRSMDDCKKHPSHKHAEQGAKQVRCSVNTVEAMYHFLLDLVFCVSACL